MTQPRIIQLPGDKRQFVVGMNWRHEDYSPKLSAMRAFGKERGKWVCKRRTSVGSHQSGYAPLAIKKAPKSLQSLAALIADAKKEPWLGVFRLGAEGEDLYWYIAVRDNQEILAEGDVVGTLEEVIEARRRHESLTDWEFVDGEDPEVLASLLKLSKGLFPVFDSTKRPWVMPTVAASGVIVAGALGMVAWKKHEEALRMQRIRAMAAQRQLQEELEASKPKPLPVMPWTQLAKPADFLAACRNAFEHTPVALEGWEVKSWTCRQTPGAHLNVVIQWQRGQGTVLATPQGVVSPDGNSVTSSVSIQPALAESAERLLMAKDTRRLVQGMTQTYDLPMKFSISTAPAPVQKPAQHHLPGAFARGKKPVKPVLPWVHGGLSLSMKFAPWVFGLAHMSSGIPGLRWTSVNFQGRGWAMTGVVYAMRTGSSLTASIQGPAPGAFPSPARMAPGNPGFHPSMNGQASLPKP